MCYEVTSLLRKPVIAMPHFLSRRYITGQHKVIMYINKVDG